MSDLIAKMLDRDVYNFDFSIFNIAISYPANIIGWAYDAGLISLAAFIVFALYKKTKFKSIGSVIIAFVMVASVTILDYLIRCLL